MIRQNRAVPILLVLTFAFILYLGGCFGSDEPQVAIEDEPPPVTTPTAPPIVTPGEPPETEDPFYHTVEDGDRLASIASKYNVTVDVIIRANPQLDPDLIIIGDKLRIPGAGTNPEVLEDVGPDRADGITVTYVVESGDTLGDIADTYTVSLDELLKRNPDVDPANLQVNALLTIPPYGTGIDPADVPPRVTPVASTRGPNDPPLQHTVVAGDSIADLAVLYNVTIQQIVDANQLDNGGNSILVGDELFIPPPTADDG